MIEMGMGQQDIMNFLWYERKRVNISLFVIPGSLKGTTIDQEVNIVCPDTITGTGNRFCCTKEGNLHAYNLPCKKP